MTLKGSPWLIPKQDRENVAAKDGASPPIAQPIVCVKDWKFAG